MTTAPTPPGFSCPPSVCSRAGSIAADEGTVPATMLVADVRGFTGICRRLGAAATATFLNRLFGAMVPCLEAEGGRIDKFIGDAVLAVFGLGPAIGAEADRALRAAIASQRAVAELNRSAVHLAGSAVAIAIGIDAGEVFFGRIGAAQCGAPTVIGASVNAAFALQKACKRYQAGILISAAVRRQLVGRYCLRRLEPLWLHAPALAATAETEPLYEVLDHLSEATLPSLRAALRHYHRGLASWRAGRITAAEQAFAAALVLNEDDLVFRAHAERCRRLRAAAMTDLCNATKRLGVRRSVRL